MSIYNTEYSIPNYKITVTFNFNKIQDRPSGTVWKGTGVHFPTRISEGSLKSDSAAAWVRYFSLDYPSKGIQWNCETEPQQGHAGPSVIRVFTFFPYLFFRFYQVDFISKRYRQIYRYTEWDLFFLRLAMTKTLFLKTLSRIFLVTSCFLLSSQVWSFDSEKLKKIWTRITILLVRFV